MTNKLSGLSKLLKFYIDNEHIISNISMVDEYNKLKTFLQSHESYIISMTSLFNIDINLTELYNLIDICTIYAEQNKKEVYNTYLLKTLKDMDIIDDNITKILISIIYDSLTSFCKQNNIETNTNIDLNIIYNSNYIYEALYNLLKIHILAYPDTYKNPIFMGSTFTEPPFNNVNPDITTQVLSNSLPTTDSSSASSANTPNNFNTGLSIVCNIIDILVNKKK